MSQLHDVIGFQTLSRLINDPNGGIPSGQLDPAFFSTTEQTEGDSAQYDVTSTTRKSARTSRYGAPAREAQGVDIKGRPIKLMHSFEQMHHKAATLRALRQPGTNLLDNRGVREVTRQLAEFRRRFTNLRINAVCSMLRHGKIYFDGEGNILPSSSGAVETVDLLVPGGNKSTLAIGGGSALLSSNWLTTSTDIGKQIQDVIDAMMEVYGVDITTVYYSKTLPGAIGKNDILKNLINGAANYSNAFLNSPSHIPDGFMNLKWRYVGGLFMEGADGTRTRWFPDNFIGFAPDVSRDWYTLFEGSYTVPGDNVIGGDVAQMIEAMRDVWGMFSYANMTVNPPTLTQFFGDTFIPALAVPGAIALGEFPVT